MSQIYHNPPHIYLDNTVYIVTSCTYQKVPYFDSDEKKNLLKKEIFQSTKLLNIKLFAWIVLSNHYHILIQLFLGKNLGKLIKLINGRSAYELNKLDNASKRKIWYNYWDTCIRSEKDFYIRLNYIHNNPIKHGYINNLTDLENYKFSSYPIYLKEKGFEWLMDSFRRYPIKDFTEKGEP